MSDFLSKLQQRKDNDINDTFTQDKQKSDSNNTQIRRSDKIREISHESVMFLISISCS